MTNYIQQNHVRMRFDKCVELFNEHDFFHKYCRKNLFDRLAPIKICPKIILNIGSATGSGSNILSRNYKDSQVYNIDLSFGMLKKSHLKENNRIKHIQKHHIFAKAYFARNKKITQIRPDFSYFRHVGAGCEI